MSLMLHIVSFLSSAHSDRTWIAEKSQIRCCTCFLYYITFLIMAIYPDSVCIFHQCDLVFYMFCLSIVTDKHRTVHLYNICYIFYNRCCLFTTYSSFILNLYMFYVFYNLLYRVNGMVYVLLG